MLLLLLLLMSNTFADDMRKALNAETTTGAETDDEYEDDLFDDAMATSAALKSLQEAPQMTQEETFVDEEDTAEKAKREEQLTSEFSTLTAKTREIGKHLKDKV